MKKNMRFLLLFPALLLSACTPNNSISGLRMPEPSTIEGNVVKMDGNDVIVRDASAEIKVNLAYMAQGTPRLVPGEHLKIKGYLNMDGNFDPLTIIREDGTSVRAVIGDRH